MAKDEQQIIEEFGEAVNMTRKELEDWLQTKESQSVGQSDGGESKGHESGRKIVAFWSAVIPPTMSIARVSRPVATAQKIRTGFEASSRGVLRYEVRLPITSAPESAEVNESSISNFITSAASK